jgi:hypothetical protein
MLTPEQAEVVEIVRARPDATFAELAEALGISRESLKSRWKRAQKWLDAPEAKLDGLGYDLDAPEKTPEQAWAEHAGAFEQKVSKILRNQWRTIHRPRGAFCIYHSTDEHLDDDAAPLRLIEQDIQAAHGMNAIMCHGGDALNNWPVAGRLAMQWAQQQCTAPDALLRLKHFITMFKPNVWTNGNHDEWNFYLEAIVKEALPPDVIQDYWTVNFRVETPGGRPCRVIMSHKFQKGSSWFHKMHGHIREMLEGQEADLLIDGHFHSDGVLDHTLAERGHSAVCVASAGYKVVDKWATRISRGGKTPKLRGRVHWMICDDQAEYDQSFIVPFKCPLQAEAYLNSLQNLRAV